MGSSAHRSVVEGGLAPLPGVCIIKSLQRTQIKEWNRLEYNRIEQNRIGFIRLAYVVTDAEKCRDGCLQAVSSDTNAALGTRMQELQHRPLRNAVYWLAPTGVLVATLVGGAHSQLRQPSQMTPAGVKLTHTHN